MTQERRVSVWQLGLLTLQILSHGLWRHRNRFGQGGMVRGPVLWAGAATGGLCRYLVLDGKLQPHTVSHTLFHRGPCHRSMTLLLPAVTLQIFRYRRCFVWKGRSTSWHPALIFGA